MFDWGSQQGWRMSKLERLNASVAQLLAVAVHEVLDVVGQAVSEYQEETARTRRENDGLKRRLRELQEVVRRAGGGAAHPLSLSVAEGRSPIEQEWSPRLREEEKGELRGQESRLSADSEGEAEVLGWTSSDATQSPGLKSDSDADCLRSARAPSASITGPFPSLASDQIKMESEPPECFAVEQHAAFQECAGAAGAAGSVGLQEPMQGPGQTHIHPERGTTARRFRFGKTGRSLPDGKKHKAYKRREEQHICFLCGKTFSRVANLRIHQRCHTGEKPYCCMQCGRCFSQAGDLKKHKRVHTGEKPYHCTHCGKSFSRGENLKRHQKTHVGEPLLL
ncbi:hypothetical protein COCON_G00201320 [Conger conger]|uniref:C2H2-type domain-containing protein n=1 Tax=Conger conger TaxID=82655 RepID=A0A9Q1HMW6_CONCO|nr:hypothetical protein COCON_G00201320 [Conger conger]